MSFGLYNVNDSGSVIIDENYMNLSFKSKGSSTSMSRETFNTNYGGGSLDIRTNITFWVIDYPGTNPILAVGPLGSGRTIVTADCLNETSTANPPPTGYKRLVLYADGNTIETLTYYVFDNINPTGYLNTGWGLQVVNASNVLVYHSSIPVMKMQAAVTLRGSTVGSNIAVSSGSAYAIVFSNQTLGDYIPAGTGSRIIQQVGIKRTSSTNLQIDSIPYWSLYNVVGAGSLEDFNPAPAMVINVTGL